MINFENLTIKQKLLTLSLLTSGTALLLARFVFLGHDIVTFRNGLIRSLSTQAEVIGYNCASAILFNDPASATQTLSALRARPNILRAAVYNKEGKAFAVWRSDKNDSRPLPALPDDGWRGHRYQRGYMESFRTIIFDNDTVGSVYLESDLRDLKARLIGDAWITAGVLMVTFIVVAVISIKLSNKISRPILELAQVAQTVSANKDYSVRALVKSQDEIGLLVSTFNEMLTEIQVSGVALRTSHEELEQRVEERTGQLEAANKEFIRLNNFLDSIIENIPNMVFVKDALELRFVRFNKAGEELLGFPRGDLIGKNDYDFFPESEADFFTGKDREVLAQKKLLDIPEEPIQTKLKGARILHTKKIPIVDDEGTPRYLLGISEDITEKKLAEENFRALLEAAPDAMVIVDNKGIITLLNKQTETLFGYRREDLLGKPVEVLIPERFRGPHAGHRGGFFGDPRARPMGVGLDLWARRQDGSEFPVEISLSPLKTAEGLLVTAAIRDVTERRQVEDSIKALNEDLKQKAAQLESANKELEAFCYSVSHDLRSPLRTIDGFSKALLEDCDEKLDAHGKDYLNRIRSGSQQMAQLIDDMLNMSRVTRSPMARENVDLSALASLIMNRLREEDPKRNVTVEIAKGLAVKGDPHLLNAVMENLLSNAWKFTSKLAEAKIEVGCSSGKDGPNTFFVRDNGAGFDMAYANKLFGAFQRLHTMAEFTGTGVGLATVQRIINRHGGRIWADSQVGQGATFYFTL